MPDVFAAYAAGLVDGEGCVRLNRCRRGNRVRYYPHVIVGLVTKEPLEKLKQVFGGSLLLRRHSKHFGKRSLWIWTVSCRSAERFLEVIVPYLLVKREQVEAILYYRREARRLKNDPNHPNPIELKILAESTYSLLAQLKRGGMVREFGDFSGSVCQIAA